jgi:hypothetical protein
MSIQQAVEYTLSKENSSLDAPVGSSSGCSQPSSPSGHAQIVTQRAREVVLNKASDLGGRGAEEEP